MQPVARKMSSWVSCFTWGYRLPDGRGRGDPGVNMKEGNPSFTLPDACFLPAELNRGSSGTTFCVGLLGIRRTLR